LTDHRYAVLKVGESCSPCISMHGYQQITAMRFSKKANSSIVCTLQCPADDCRCYCSRIAKFSIINYPFSIIICVLRTIAGAIIPASRNSQFL